MKRSIGLSVLKELSHVRSWLRAIGPLDVLHAHSTKAGLLLAHYHRGRRMLGSIPRTPIARLTFRFLGLRARPHRSWKFVCWAVREFGRSRLVTLSMSMLQPCWGGTLDSGLSEMGCCRTRPKCAGAPITAVRQATRFGRGVL